MDLKSAIRRIGLARVEFSPGSICRLKDDVINFPDDEENRQEHDYRTVLVLSNDTTCSDISYPLVTIAPMSSKLKWGTALEVVIQPTKSNKLALPSRVMLAHIQPVLKTDIEKHIGDLGLDDWENVMHQIVTNFDRA
jgi:mRNA-degrading endonuclease toxin of MazEF toxin-antitoxin module